MKVEVKYSLTTYFPSNIHWFTCIMIQKSYKVRNFRLLDSALVYSLKHLTDVVLRNTDKLIASPSKNSTLLYARYLDKSRA